jgi:hypothetical protein
LKSATIPAFEDESDRLALLEFKNGIGEDPLQIISSWNDSTHFCNWFGVICSPSTKRVMVLNLEDQRLVGTIPPSVGNITYLTRINLEITASMVKFLKKWEGYGVCSIST